MNEAPADPMTQVLATFRRQETTDWGNAWVGMEPTFQSKRSIRKYAKIYDRDGGNDDAYFTCGYMLRTQKRVARAIQKKYQAYRKAGHPACMFERVELKSDRDQWDVRRQNLHFHWAGERHEPFTVRFALDPETFEYSIKPVPLVWFYEPRFVAFLEEFLWQVPAEHGLTPSIGYGGAQFSLSAKTYLQGSLLADDIATKLNHPELATWIMDWPNADDRAFRATRRRFEAFRDLLRHYWAGGFHPRALGGLTVENALLDRGFGPACSPPAGLMGPGGPTGTAREVFQTNFAFARAVRWLGQNVQPGYWQKAHPDLEGYRPDQIMRYGEGNLNRLQIAGELHVKSDKVLDVDQVPELESPLELGMLTQEASWENRAQLGRTSARDFVEALLLEVHHAQFLQQQPHVTVQESLLQDQLLGDAVTTLARHGGEATLASLRQEARTLNLEASHGRIRSDWIEPETLFWAAWKVLPANERADLAREVISAFYERVTQAASLDPRPEFQREPLEWHRHRVHPLLWEALSRAAGPLQGELAAWEAKRPTYLARRPTFSQVGEVPPWE